MFASRNSSSWELFRNFAVLEFLTNCASACHCAKVASPRREIYAMALIQFHFGKAPWKSAAEGQVFWASTSSPENSRFRWLVWHQIVSLPRDSPVSVFQVVFENVILFYLTQDFLVLVGTWDAKKGIIWPFYSVVTSQWVRWGSGLWSVESTRDWDSVMLTLPATLQHNQAMSAMNMSFNQKWTGDCTKKTLFCCI